MPGPNELVQQASSQGRACCLALFPICGQSVTTQRYVAGGNRGAEYDAASEGVLYAEKKLAQSRTSETI
jgi:hypothetical protein